MKKQKGQTLLEILLALGVSILALSAVILSVATSLSNAQFAKNQSLANSYAREGITIIRQIRDSSWGDFHSKASGDYCLPQNNVLGVYSGNCYGNVGIFARKVTIAHDSQSCCPGVMGCASNVAGSKVTVGVSWTDNKCNVGSQYCHNVEVITCLSNLDQKSML